MTRHKDRTGQQFGSLTVKELSPTATWKTNAAHWICTCVCGKQVIVAANSLQSGNIKSCGCQKYLHGYKHTEEAKARIGAAAKINQLGENNSVWKGDKVSYIGIHMWLLRHYPKTGVCDTCGKVGKTDHAYKHSPEPYTRNREDYFELCRGCHLRLDGNSKKKE